MHVKICVREVALSLIFFRLQSKKQYEKAFKESERAQETYKKADADINLSRAEVEKVNSSRVIYSILINY